MGRYRSCRPWVGVVHRHAAPSRNSGIRLYRRTSSARLAGDHSRRGVFLAGLGVPYMLNVAVAALAVTSMITVLQRIAQVRKQAKAANARFGLRRWLHLVPLKWRDQLRNRNLLRGPTDEASVSSASVLPCCLDAHCRQSAAASTTAFTTGTLRRTIWRWPPAWPGR